MGIALRNDTATKNQENADGRMEPPGTGGGRQPPGGAGRPIPRTAFKYPV